MKELITGIFNTISLTKSEKNELLLPKNYSQVYKIKIGGETAFCFIDDVVSDRSMIYMPERDGKSKCFKGVIDLEQVYKISNSVFLFNIGHRKYQAMDFEKYEVSDVLNFDKVQKKDSVLFLHNENKGFFINSENNVQTWRETTIFKTESWDVISSTVITVAHETNYKGYCYYNINSGKVILDFGSYSHYCNIPNENLLLVNNSRCSDIHFIDKDKGEVVKKVENISWISGVKTISNVVVMEQVYPVKKTVLYNTATNQVMSLRISEFEEISKDMLKIFSLHGSSATINLNTFEISNWEF